MQHLFRTLISAASIAVLASCASTGENTDQAALDETVIQPGQPTQETYSYGYGQTPGGYETAPQPGQEAYSYAYGQAPSGYDSYDTTGGGYPGAGQARQPGQSVAAVGGGAGSADRVVYFDFDSADIQPESRAIIEANARQLAGNPRIITQLEGHTDERGSREYNIALGERRANAVRQVMSAMGVSPQQIRIVSFGEERPAAAGSDERSYTLNRRVEIVY